MRKRCFVALLALLLSGCGAQETFETISDEQIQSVSAEMREILVDITQKYGCTSVCTI